MKGDISPLLPRGTLLFSGYDDNNIQVNHESYRSGLYIHQGQLVSPWGPERLRDLSISHLKTFIENPPEVLIIGTGRLTAFPSEEIMQFLSGHHIGYEFMDSRAAARTYNILVSEGRPTSAALLLPNARK